jgi:hypothetical protein
MERILDRCRCRKIGSLRLHADHEGPPFTKESPATIAPGMMALVAHGLLA